MDYHRHSHPIPMIKKITALLIICGLILSACSNKPKRPELKPPYIIENLQSMPFDEVETILTGKLTGTELTRSELKIIRPEDSTETMGGQRETLLRHLFVGLATTTYQDNSAKIYVELYKFADPTNSYGYYSLNRPTGITNEKIGAEAYITGNSLYFVKDAYMFVLSIESEKNDKIEQLKSAASSINDNIGGGNQAPNFFKLFPYGKIIYPSGQYHPYRFNNIPGFNEVYTTKYLIDEDTLTLFLTVDTIGDKLFFLKDFTGENNLKSVPVNQFPYEKGNSIAFEIKNKGILVGGLVQGKLVGAIGYIPQKHESQLRKWLIGFK